MKNLCNIVLMGVFTLLVFSARAQNPKVESLRVAYITEQLQLTPEEGQKFWPVYNQYRAEIKSLRQAYRLDASGEDESQLADKKFEFEEKKLALMKKYRPQIEQAIGARKFGMLITAEERFKGELLKRIQENRGGR